MNFSRMKSKEIVLSVSHQFPMIAKIMVVTFGVHHPQHIRETFVLNSKDRKKDFTGAFNLFRLPLNIPTSHNPSDADPLSYSELRRGTAA